MPEIDVLNRAAKVGQANDIHDQHKMFFEVYPATVDPTMENKAYERALKEVEEYLSNSDPENQKYQRFLAVDIMNRPSKLVQINQMLMNFDKQALYAQDKRVDVVAKNNNDLETLQDFRNEKIKDFKFIEEVAYPQWWINPSNFVLIDYPQGEVYSTRGIKPIISILDVKNCKDWEHDSRGNLIYVQFFKSVGGVKYLCEFNREVRSIKNLETNEVVAIPHNLPRCPAEQLSSLKLSTDYPEVKKSFPTSAIGLCKNIWRWLNFEDHAASYSAFSIYWFISQGKEFTIEQKREEYSKMYSSLSDQDINYRAQIDGQKEYNEEGFVGSGTTVRIQNTGENTNFQAPVGRLDADVNGLQNIDQKILGNFKLLSWYLTGEKEEVINTQAVNQDQIAAGLLNRNQINNVIASEMYRINKFILDTVFMEVFPDKFKEVSGSYGNEFFELTLDVLYDRYEKAKNNGMYNQLSSISDMIISTQFKNNPNKLEVERLKNAITPYYLISNSEMLQLRDKDIVSEDEVVKKINMPNYINQFETEYFKLDSFDKEVAFDQKVKVLNEVIDQYILESKNNKDAELQQPEQGMGEAL